MMQSEDAEIVESCNSLRWLERSQQCQASGVRRGLIIKG